MTLSKKAGGVLLGTMQAERIEIAYTETASYCLIPPPFKEREFCTLLMKGLHQSTGVINLPAIRNNLLGLKLAKHFAQRQGVKVTVKTSVSN